MRAQAKNVDTNRKRKWRPSPGTGTVIVVRLNPKQLRAVKQAAKQHKTSNPEALRRMAFHRLQLAGELKASA